MREGIGGSPRCDEGSPARVRGFNNRGTIVLENEVLRVVLSQDKQGYCLYDVPKTDQTSHAIEVRIVGRVLSTSRL